MEIKHKFFSSFHGGGMFWFRIFGYGICCKDLRKWNKLFSERHGYTKTIDVKNWSFTFLKP